MRRASMVLIAALLAAACGRKLATVKTELGSTSTQSLALEEGTRLQFPVSALFFTYDDAMYIELKVELLREQDVVASVDCRGFSFSRKRTVGAGNAKTVTARDCVLTVPEGGADAVRVSTQVDQGKASVKGLKVHVKQVDDPV
jgi:hypothetical protein